MGSFEIIKRNGEKVQLQTREPFCAVKSAVQNTSLMGDDNVQLSFVSRDLINLEKGDKILVFGEEYTLRTKAAREMLSETHYTYEATFYGVMYELMKSLYRNTDANGKSTKSTFDLTYSIKDFIKVLIYNVERDYPGLWKFDEANCPDTEPITLQFSKQNCLQVLQTLCSKENFNLEFRITQANGVRTIHIGKFGSKVVPPGGNAFFEWGKGNGLYKLKEEKVDDKAIITRLWVEGGTTNIRSGYRGYSERLQLPYPKRLNKKEHTLADGTVIPAESEYIGIDDDAKRYFEDAELREMLGSDEDSKEYDNIHPTRTGEVTALVDGDVNSFIDNTMDFDLCEKDAEGTKYLISGVTAKINFISGKLAGQQFEIAAEGGYIHSEKKFKLIPFTDERGLTIPTTGTNEAFRISVGDKYKITDINLPESYEQAAEEDLWYAGYDDFLYMKQARAQYQLTLDRKYFVDSLPEDSDTTVFKVGDYVPVRDTRFGIEKNIRIQKVSRNLLLEHDYALTLSDVTAISVYSQTVVDVIKHNQIIENNRLRDLNKARKGWRTTEELRNMVYDTDGYFDPENIRPNSIDTNMLTVGSKSQQFVLIDVVLEPNVSGLGNRLNASAGVLAHLSVEEDGVRQWSMGASEFTMANSGGYYLFAKCSKTGDSGVWYLTQKQLKFEPTDDPNNYYFQVGILSSLYEDGFRDFVTTYGFTRINGNTITTGKIVTSDGECYLDLDGNKFRIGDANSCIDWGVTAKGQLTLKNVRLLSQSGDTSHLGVYRGTYNSNYVYYPGDEVDYTNGGETCTYRYINANPTAGNAPTNSVYWAVIAKGSKGETGNSVFYTYNDSQSKPATPTGSGNTNGWHTESTESVVWMSIKTAKTIADGTWGTPFRVRGADGTSITIKGTVTSVSQLPATGNENGDAYLLDGYLYIWTGTSWSNVGKIQGEAGKSSYLHKKYSDDGGKTFTAGNGETPGRWLGLYVDQIATDSDDPAKYTWSDTKGEQGIPGEPGEDGRTTYLHIKYSNDGGLSFTAGNGEEPGSYIGQYTDYEQMDSDDPTRYTWAKIKGDSGSAGTDAAAGEYFEYRYAKNGSTTEPPELDQTATEPAGWSTVMPTPGELEYVWCTMAKKSGIVDKTQVYVPITMDEVWDEETTAADLSGNGYDAILGKNASFVEDHWKDGWYRAALQLTGNGEARIPYDLPFGESFTLCFWIKTDQRQIKWMFNGYNGRDYEENSIDVTANTWLHLAFRFNDRTVSVFKNGVLLHSANLSEHPVGFSLYDDNMFGSTVLFDDIRILNGALPLSDITKVMNGDADSLIQNWSKPVRVNPYDGKDGKDGKAVTLVDVEYAISTSNTTAPTSGWQTAAPTWEDGKYIWSRTKTTYSDGATSTTKAACITGGTGATGGTGVGVSSIVEQYYLSTSATSLLGGSWSTTRPEWEDKKYIWTRSVITYTNGTSTTTAAICVTGSQGNNGADGANGANQGSNLLYCSSFHSTDRWSIASGVQIVDGLDGNKALYCQTEDGTKDVAKQILRSPTVNTIEAKQWYTLSFWVKGSGRMAGFVYPSAVNTAAVGKVDGESKVHGTDTYTPFTLTDTWTKHCITFKTKDSFDPSVTQSLLFRLYENSTIYICMPKLEKGEVATDWCLSEFEKTGPAALFRGTYDSQKQYKGSFLSVDVVKYSGVYYVARVDAGVFSGQIPTNTKYWNTFGAQFEQIATNLLLAEFANIGNLIIKDDCIISQKGKVNGADSSDYTNSSFIPNIKIDGKNGKISVYDGVFYGSMAEPPKTLASSGSISLDFNTGFNFAGYTVGTQKIVLPTDAKYNGVHCTITNTKSNGDHYNIVCNGGRNFMYSCNNASMLEVSSIHLYGVGDLRLRAILDSDGKLQWFVENDMSFSYDYANKAFSNGISSSIARLIDVFELQGNSISVNFCADNNKPYIASYNKSGQWWNIKFTKSRSGHKKKYMVIVTSKLCLFSYWVKNITDTGFYVGFDNTGFITLTSDGTATVQIFEYD